MLLAIDTSAGTSVAVVDANGTVRAERSEADTMRHAEVVGRLISECLVQAGASGRDVTAVVAGMGPGPFTGLRVGIAAARVFSLAIDRPLLALVSHDAVALTHYEAGHHGQLIVITDARRRELFWSRYSGTDPLGLPDRTAGPGIVKPADLAAELEAESVAVAVAAAVTVAVAEADAEPHAESTITTRVDATEISAASLGIIAAHRLAAGLPFEPDDALYLRSPDVTPPTGIKRVTR